MREDTRAEDAGHRRPGTTHPAMHRADRADGADGIEATDGTGAPKHSNPATTLLIIFRIPKSIPIIFSARICATRLIMTIRYPHPASQSHCQ